MPSKERREDEKAAVELSKTVQLAVQAFDGHQLSDEELECLCDAALGGPVSLADEEAKP